jgi:hypothetical protein
MQATAYEWEVLPELDGEWEMEGEWELEGEMESEEFFGQLAGLARRAVPALRRVGLQAARSALSGGFLPQQEFELEGKWEWEAAPAAPRSPAAAAALMEHLGHAATQAESEEEAEAFIGALIPLAAQILPRIAPAILRAAPRLIRGAANVARTLRSNPSTRQLVRTMPTIVGRTVQSLGSQVAQGRPVTGQTAARTLARQTQRVLGNPQQAVQAYRHSRALDRRYHGQPAGPLPAAAAAPSPGMPRRPCTCGGAGPATGLGEPESFF